MFKQVFPFYKQLDAMDCGPTCLRMIAKYFGRSISLEFLRNKSEFGKEGITMLGLADAAESIGLKAIGTKLTLEQLVNEVTLPAILYWDQYHFVVLVPGSTINRLLIADPARGIIKMGKKEFLDHWIASEVEGTGKGVALLLENTPLFSEMDLNFTEQNQKKRIGWNFIISYLL